MLKNAAYDNWKGLELLYIKWEHDIWDLGSSSYLKMVLKITALWKRKLSFHFLVTVYIVLHQPERVQSSWCTCAVQGFFFSSILAFVTHGNSVVFTSHVAQSRLFILLIYSCQTELLGTRWACASVTELAASTDVSESAGSPQLLQAPWGKKNF